MALPSRKAPLAVAVALATAVAGCALEPDGGYRTANLNTTVPVTQAFMVPPPGGPEVVAVLEQRYRNGLQQDIILENATGVPGQNVVYVRAYGPMGREGGRQELPSDLVELSDIRRELVERFPGVHMELSGLYAQNRYGPFSYATGRTRSGANCIYVWQRIASEGAVFKWTSGSIVWRLRLCDDRTSMRDLLLTAYGFTVSGYFLSQRWNPYGDPPPPDPRVGLPGEAILPEQVVDPTVIAPSSFNEASRPTIAAPSRPPRRPVQSAATVARPTVLNEPAPGAAVVPRPEGTNLTEPVIEGSNLPNTAAPLGPTFSVPRTPQSLVPSPARPGAPLPTGRPAPTVPPPPPGARVIVPGETNAAAPTVRVVN
jgi:hypothetical protein